MKQPCKPASEAREGTSIAASCCLRPRWFLENLLDQPVPVGQEVLEFQRPQALVDPQVQWDLVDRLRRLGPLAPWDLSAQRNLEDQLVRLRRFVLGVRWLQQGPVGLADRWHRSVHLLPMGLAALEDPEAPVDLRVQASAQRHAHTSASGR